MLSQSKAAIKFRKRYYRDPEFRRKRVLKNRERRRRNPEASRAYAREYSRGWKKRNPARAAAQVKAWRKRKEEQDPSYRLWFRLRSRSNELGLPRFESRTAFARWYYSVPKACEYCGISEFAARAIFSERLHLDRIVPKLGYSDGNICLACRRCNSIKGEWLTYDEMKAVAAEYVRPKIMPEVVNGA